MEDNRFYSHIAPCYKAHAFDVLDYFSANRKSFDHLCFSKAFGKLFDECKQFMDIDDDDLASAVNIVLTLEQRRISSYSPGNTHIEDYVPANVKSWDEYLQY